MKKTIFNEDEVSEKSPINSPNYTSDTVSVNSNATCHLTDAQATVTLSPSRRKLLKVAIGSSLAGTAWPSAHAAKPPEKMRPKAGDVLVRWFGKKKGQPITPDDVPPGAELLEASAMDPQSQIMRDGSRLNGINLVRIDAASLDETTRPFAAGGIVAYSSVCTHQGCDLTQWLPDTTTFKCYCHYSEFNVTKMGAPIHGPAKRKLAILPITLNEAKELVVADAFQGKVGFKK